MMKSLRLLLIGTSLLIAAAAALAVEGDIVFIRQIEPGGTSPAVFPHWIHRIRYKCYACHDAVFRMKRGENPITMDAIREGKFCGVCHDGKIAWAITFDSCNRCHVGQ